MLWVKTADFIRDRSWPILYQKMVFKSRGQNTTWRYTDDVNYVILVASWIIQTKQLWQRVWKHRKWSEEEHDIASLEPQTSKVLKIRPLCLEYMCIIFHLIRLWELNGCNLCVAIGMITNARPRSMLRCVQHASCYERKMSVRIYWVVWTIQSLCKGDQILCWLVKMAVVLANFNSISFYSQIHCIALHTLQTLKGFWVFLFC